MMHDPTHSSEYLVISRGQWDADLPQDEIQTAINDFYRWLDRLVEEGRMKTGQRLAGDGATVSRKGTVLDGPFGETKEVIGGYWFIVADSLEEAAAIAAENPCMKCGLFYEIRPIDPQHATVSNTITESPAR